MREGRREDEWLSLNCILSCNFRGGFSVKVGQSFEIYIAAIFSNIIFCPGSLTCICTANVISTRLMNLSASCSCMLYGTVLNFSNRRLKGQV